MKHTHWHNLQLLELCVYLWNTSEDSMHKRRTISLSLSQDTRDKHAGLACLFSLMNEQLRRDSLADSFESYVSRLQFISVESDTQAIWKYGCLTEKMKSDIGFYFMQMFQAHCIHKLPFPLSGFATVEIGPNNLDSFTTFASIQAAKIF